MSQGFWKAGAVHAHEDVSMAPGTDPTRGGVRREVSEKQFRFDPLDPPRWVTSARAPRRSALRQGAESATSPFQVDGEAAGTLSKILELNAP